LSPYFDESVAIFRSLDDQLGIWRGLGNLAETRIRLGDLDGARRFSEGALAAARSIGFIWGTSQALRQLGVILHRQGDTAQAIARLEESLAGFESLRANHGGNWALLDLGQAYLTAGDPSLAAARFRESLVRCHAGGDRYSIARCLEGLAGSAVAAGAQARGAWWDDAARLLGAAAALRQTINFAVAPVEQPALDRAVAATQGALGEDAYERLPAEGGTLTLSQAVELGLKLAEQIGASAPVQASREPIATGERHGRGAALTPREREVAVLVGRGYSNRRIAEALVIAEKTAEVHARNIREKLGLASRSQIAAWAAQQGMLAPDA
jgi:non-specific serine/threonine protein kinase